ncbi:PREDICTED: dual specificity mitogen-activated protein kinase kinase 7 [Cyprinodon variegatus]|uniref:dual specificity mitogen-activated protein kinase kinase 7 n=1 Tax=Cyprinodon variegatus TaxID=28743 RepID=UPI00074281D5|nr:PREDICTED: dual specificity mitogen-activated protein kinase kinase 7 [Cyprinodon variegatus]
MSSLEQRLSRIEEKLKLENEEARRKIDIKIDMSPQRSRPRPIIVIQLSPAPAPSQRAGIIQSIAPHATAPPNISVPWFILPLSFFFFFSTSDGQCCVEIDQKLQEIMRQTGYLKIDGQQMRRTGNKDENKRILMDLDVVLKSHDCPYIIQCYGAIVTNTDVFIAMELMGTCAEKLKKRIQGPIPERILGKMTVAIVKALLYLKEKHGVIHRDVKPSNILIDAKGQIKLCDFGISGRLVDSKAKTRSAGCAAYMAPERIDPPDPTKPDYDIRADVWSLGISLVELATGQFPYKNCKTDFEVLTKVLQEDPPVLPLSMGFSLDFQSFVKDCLTKDHRKRPKYHQLLEHSFIRRYEVLEVDVAGWFQTVMERTESPRSSQCYSHQHMLHSLLSR